MRPLRALMRIRSLSININSKTNVAGHWPTPCTRKYLPYFYPEFRGRMETQSHLLRYLRHSGIFISPCTIYLQLSRRVPPLPWRKISYLMLWKLCSLLWMITPLMTSKHLLRRMRLQVPLKVLYTNWQEPRPCP